MKNLIKLTLITGIIFFLSCKKEDIKSPTRVLTESNTLIPANKPTNKGGILHFKSWLQYDNYIHDLEIELDLPTTTDIDSTLFFIEKIDLNNFYSLRQKINIDNGLTTSDLWIDESASFSSEDIDNMFLCDYIGDDIEKSILNIFSEVLIGDSLFIYFSANILLKMHYSETSLRDLIREIEKCSDQLDPVLVDSRITIISDIFDGLIDN